MGRQWLKMVIGLGTTIRSAANVEKTMKKILIVEDVELNRDFFEQLLEDDYQTVTAADGASAIELASGFSPEVILLDLGLPDVQGLELIPRFRELDEMTGVIVLTAFTMFFVAGGSIWQLMLIVPLGLAAVAGVVLMKPYMLQRVVIFMDPFADPANATAANARNLIHGRFDMLW